jgi:putative phosphoesterase
LRTAVISDIHGNCVALDAVLEELRAEQPDQMVCLGDVAQGGPQPKDCVDRVRELACPVVMGNTDYFLVSDAKVSAEETTDATVEVAKWTLSQLSPEDIRLMEGFRPTVELPIGGKADLLCFHGSPSSFDDVILPETDEDEFQKMVGDYSSFVLTGGHTHLQQLRRIGDSFFFNPGSVGLAYNRHQDPADYHFDPWAEYAILNSEDSHLRIEMRRVPFDVARYIDVIKSSGLPYGERTVSRYLAASG